MYYLLDQPHGRVSASPRTIQYSVAKRIISSISVSSFLIVTVSFSSRAAATAAYPSSPFRAVGSGAGCEAVAVPSGNSSDKNRALPDLRPEGSRAEPISPTEPSGQPPPHIRRLSRDTGRGILQNSTSTTEKKAPVLLTITTEPGAIVWIDEIRRGVTDQSGKLAITKLKPGRHSLRVRASGFKESSVPLLPGRREVSVKLLPTTDQAELTFQEAETARERAKDDEGRRTSADLYRRALKLRPNFPSAHVGLARVLLDLNNYDEALNEIAAARRVRPVYPEASAVEGRIYREQALNDEAIKSFRRAIQEGRGFQPEAHVGLARVWEEKGSYTEAIAEYRKALDQLSDSEPIIYQLLGAAYDKQQQYKEALVAYEKYLELAPNGTLAPAVRSIIEQLKRDAQGQEIIP